MPKLIAITNPKGGTGKSTTTVALAALAARDGLRVLVIDLDPQEHASFLSKADGEVDHAKTAAAMFRPSDATVPSVLARSTVYGYDLVPAGGVLGEGEDALRSDSFGPTRLRKLFKRDEGLKHYDVVFIDTSANKTRMLISVLMAATHILIPMQAGNTTMNEFGKFIEIIDGINEQRSDFGAPPLVNYGVLFTMVKDGTRANEAVIAALAEQMRSMPGTPVSPIRIPHSVVVVESELARAPVTVARPNETVARRYAQYWESISGPALSTQAVAV